MKDWVDTRQRRRLIQTAWDLPTAFGTIPSIDNRIIPFFQVFPIKFDSKK